MQKLNRLGYFVEALIASLVVVLGAYAGAELLILFRPWRSVEIYVALSLTIVLGISLSILTVGRRTYRAIWRSVLAVCALSVASGHALLYFDSRSTNLPSLSTYFDTERAGIAEEHKSADLTQALWGRFRESRPVPIKKLEALFAQPYALSGRFLTPESQKTIADAVLKSQFEFLDYPAAQLSDDLRWSENPYKDRSWNWFLHNMSYVSILSEEYRKTGELKYLERAEDLILDWIADNSAYSIPVSKFSWDDHTTAFRLMNWLYFWEIWSKSSLFDEEKMALILRSMMAHAERLASAEFYRKHHNHGIDQDRALIAFTLTFPELEQSNGWQSLALKRMEAEILFAVSPAGVHLEHSPGYQFYGLRQLQEVTSLLSNWGVEHDLSARLPQIMESMALYVKHIVQPNGRIVPIGDTPMRHISGYAQQLAPFVKQDRALMCLLSDGDLCEGLDDVAVFPDEGYVIIRDFDRGRLPFDKSFYLFFTAAANEGRAHKQADDLSFVLSFGGHELLTDPGQYSYKRGAGREYVLSTRAHNTVLIDGTGFSREGRDARLDDFLSTEEFTAINASHGNYEQFEHSRWLLHIRPSLLILVDTLKRKEGVLAPDLEQPHQFTQLFHSSNQIRMRVVGREEEVWFLAPETEGGHPLMRILQAAPVAGTPRITSGQDNPMLGWTSPRHGVLEPAPVVTFQIEGTGATFVTIIELNMHQEKPIEEPFNRSSFSADIRANEIAVKWMEGGVRRGVILNRKASSIHLSP
ncbi:MAG: alginate lyase family protein [Alphaproteobacteria bacterium]|nr:alginate lyase family protein [Alphaproteobacteria bacterium]